MISLFVTMVGYLSGGSSDDTQQPVTETIVIDREMYVFDTWNRVTQF